MLSRGFVVASLFGLSLLNHALGASAQSSPSPPPSPSEINYGRRVTPSLLVLIIILILAFFFMGFFSIYVRYCCTLELANSRLTGETIYLGRGSRAMRGLEPSLVETFPTLQYSEAKAHKIGKGGIECAICINEFEENETLRLIPNCNHVFHQDCIDPWLAAHVTCPVCRANLQSQSKPEEPPAVHQIIEVEPGPANTIEPAVEPTLGTSGARSGRREWRLFPRSHTTGHSLVQPGENMERFTLRLPENVRQRIMTRQLERSVSLVALPKDRSYRQGYRADEGGRGTLPRPPSRLSGPAAKSGHWVLPRNLSFFSRASSFLTRVSSRSQKQGEGSPTHSTESKPSEPERPHV